MRLLAPLSLVAALAAAAPAAGAPACDAPLGAPGTGIVLPAVLGEGDRLGLSAGVYLALRDRSGAGAWPDPQVDGARPCPLGSFEADEAVWTISGGAGDTPPRFVTAPDHEEYYFLAAGPNLAAARAWATGSRAEPTGDRAYYLAAASGAARYVLRIYDGAPSSRQLSDDIVAAMSGRLPFIAAFDPEGDTVTVLAETESGRPGQVFEPARIHSGRTATLLGADGRFFEAVEPGAVAMRGSGLLCAARYGSLVRERLTVLDARDDSLDLACRLEGADSWVSVFSTRHPDPKGDKAWFKASLKDAKKDGVAGRVAGDRTGEIRDLRAGEAWRDKAGKSQGLWFIRRGDFLIEVRATFEPEATGEVFDALRAFAGNTLPEAKIRDGAAD
jgi:hypothetical protein